MLFSTTLCPGGAFMLHESVAEFDPNAQGAVTPEMVNQVRDELKPVVSTYDPVDKLILKLTPL